MEQDATNSNAIDPMNLGDLQGKIKAIGQLSISATAKLVGITVLTTGLKTAAEIAPVVGIPKSTVYRALSDVFEHAGDLILTSLTVLTIPTNENLTVLTNEKETEKPVSLVSPVRISEPESSCARDITTRANNELPSEVVIEDRIPPNPQKPTFGRTQALEAFHAYNDTALRCGLAQASRMTPDRERKIIARLKEFGLEGWHRSLANIEKSPFLKGEGGDGKWRASLDFMLQASSFAKLHDGAYSSGDKPAPKPAAPTRSRFLDDDSWQQRVAQDMIDRGLASVIN